MPYVESNFISIPWPSYYHWGDSSSGSGSSGDKMVKTGGSTEGVNVPWLLRGNSYRDHFISYAGGVKVMISGHTK